MSDQPDMADVEADHLERVIVSARNMQDLIKRSYLSQDELESLLTRSIERGTVIVVKAFRRSKLS